MNRCAPLSLGLLIFAALACNLPGVNVEPTAIPSATPQPPTTAPLPPTEMVLPTSPALPTVTLVPPSPTPAGIVYPRPELGFTAMFPEGWMLKQAWPGAPESACAT